MVKIKIGITGQSGFIGFHLFNYLNLFKDKFEIIPFEDSYFNDSNQLKVFLKSCDVVIHLAAVNRHNEANFIYQTNLELINKVINALEGNMHPPFILFSSSAQEDNSTPYGESKRQGRILLENWSNTNNAKILSLIIPNVFGPFGKPFFNSVIATFSYQLTHDFEPQIQVDNNLKLIYVQDLVRIITDKIIERSEENIFKVPSTAEMKVTQILKTLKKYKDVYYINKIFPKLSTKFELDLFNTFRSYIDSTEFFPSVLKVNSDERGSFIEILKAEGQNQVSYSTTKPGVTRGEHFHTRKIERFIVIKGEAEISMRKIGSNDILKFRLNGKKPSFVDIPVWYTHNIKNIGTGDLYTIFWINEFFDKENPDTYFEKINL